jgi:hypothetical protein
MHSAPVRSLMIKMNNNSRDMMEYIGINSLTSFENFQQKI